MDTLEEKDLPEDIKTRRIYSSVKIESPIIPIEENGIFIYSITEEDLKVIGKKINK